MLKIKLLDEAKDIVDTQVDLLACLTTTFEDNLQNKNS